MNSPTLLVRADASVASGTGHVMRCLALAQAWQDAGGRVVFVMAECLPQIQNRLQANSVEVVPIQVEPGTTEDSQRTFETAGLSRSDWVVVDGYRFSAAYQHALKSSGLKVLFLDDNAHCDYYWADLVLNQNPYADPALYANRSSETRLLVGLKYALLRREFRRFAAWQRSIPAVALKVLITLGGTDGGNFTLRVLQALPSIALSGLKVRVAVGGGNPHVPSLQHWISDCSQDIELLADVSDMAEQIAWADVGVAAAGTVSWEICSLGLPSLMVATAENQIAAAKEMSRREAAVVVRPDLSSEELGAQLQGLMLSQEERKQLSSNARYMLDTDGSGRVVEAILGSSG